MSNIPQSRKFAGKLSRYVTAGNADAAPPMGHYPIAAAVVREAGPQTQDALPSGNSSDGQPALCTVRVASGDVHTVHTAVTHSVATDTINTGPGADQVVRSMGSKRSHSPEPFDPSKHVRVYTTLKNKRGRSPSPPPIQGPLPPHIIRAPAPTPRPDAKRFKAGTSDAMSPPPPPHGARFGSTQRRRFGLTQQDNARRRAVLSSDAILALLIQNNLQDSTTANLGDSTGNPILVERRDVEPSLRPAETDSTPAVMQVVELDSGNEDARDEVDNNAADGETSARNPVMTQTLGLPSCSADTEGAYEGTELQGSWDNAGAMLSGNNDRGQRMNCSPRHSDAESASAGRQVVEHELDSQVIHRSVDHNTDGSVALIGNSGMVAGKDGPSSCLSIEFHSEKEDRIDDDNDVDNSATEISTASPIVSCSEDDNKAKFFGNEIVGASGGGALQNKPGLSLCSRDQVMGCENEVDISRFSDLSPTIEVLNPISNASEVDEEENWEDTDDDMFLGEQDTMDADDSEVDMLLKEEDAYLVDSSSRLVCDADQEDGQECGVHVNAAPAADVIIRDEYAAEAACRVSLLRTDDMEKKDDEGGEGVHDSNMNGGPTAGTLPRDENTTEAACAAFLPNADDEDDEDWEDIDTEVDGDTATGIVLGDETTTKTACETSLVYNKKPSASSKDETIREEVKADEEMPLSLPNADDEDDEDWEDIDTEVDGDTATGIVLGDETTTKTAYETSLVNNKNPIASSKDEAIREEVKADEEMPLSALSPSTGSASQPQTVRSPFEFIVGSEVPQRISFFPAMLPAPPAPSLQTTGPQVHSVSAEAPTHPNHATQLENQSPTRLSVAPQDHVSPDIPAASDSHQRRTVVPNSESVHHASQGSTMMPGVAHSQILLPPLPQLPLPHVARLTSFIQRTPRQYRPQPKRNQRKSSPGKALERFQQPTDALDVGVPLENSATGQVNAVADEIDTDVIMADSMNETGDGTHSQRGAGIHVEVNGGKKIPFSALSQSTGSASQPKNAKPSFEPFVVGSEAPQRISFFPAMPPAPPAPSLQTTGPQVHSVSAEAPTHPNHATQLGNQSPTRLSVVSPDHLSPDIPAASDSHQHKTVVPNSESVHQVSQGSAMMPDVAHSQLLQPHLPHVAPSTSFAQRTPRQYRSQAERDQRKSSSKRALERFQQPADALDVGVPLEHSATGQVNAVADEIDTDVIMADPMDEDGNGRHSQGEVDIPDDDDVVRKYKDLVSNPNVPCTNSTAVFIIDMVAELQSNVNAAIEDKNSQIPSSSVNENTGRARRGGVSSPPRIKHTVQYRTKDRIILQEDIHRLAKELLKLSTENLRVPPAQEILLFEKGKDSTVGPRIEDLVLDLDRNGIASSWNKKAAELFVSEFISRKVSPCTDRRVIQEAFNTYLLALQRTYKKQVLRTSTDEAAKVSIRDKAKQRAGYNRRSYKLERRNSSFKQYAHIPGVAEIIDELEHIPVDAMSGDEIDYADGKSYLINTNCDWRSKDGDDLFDICDALYMSTRFRPDGRPTNGRFPDPRTASARPDTLPAPARLPANLYDAQYLSGLTDEEKRKLDMRPAFEFLIPVELLQIAERYRSVKTRQMMPLSRDHPRLTQYTQPGTSLLKM